MTLKDLKYLPRPLIAAALALIAIAAAAVIFTLRACSAPTSTSAAPADTLPVTPRQLSESKAMAARLDSLVSDTLFCNHAKTAISVFDLTTHRYIFSLNDQELLVPASCMKIPNVIAGIRILGLDYAYHESLQLRGTMRGDTLVGDLLLAADDDPMLDSLTALTDALYRSGVHAIRGNVSVSLAREDTLRPHPSAKIWDIPYNRLPLLLKGKEFVHRAVLGALQHSGVSFFSDPTVHPTGSFRTVATASSTLRSAMIPMLLHSSNIKSEAMFYRMDYHQRLIPDHRMHWTNPHAAERFLRTTFCSDSTMTIDGAPLSPSTRTMSGFVFNDGSGLSPDNRLTASFLVDVLRYAYADQAIRNFFINEGLATPNDSLRAGSLHTRMLQPEFKGRIFCKTGTIVTIGVSSLAGFLHARDGHWYAFSIINSDTPIADARQFQDRLCQKMLK